MSLPRQVAWFVVVGGCQLALDWLVFVMLSAAGLPPGIANVCSRLAGALLGFWLNGQITFAAAGPARPGSFQLYKFALFWMCATLVSSGLMMSLASRASLPTAWLVKPLVEAVLAVISFFVSRHWVYR